MYGLLAPEMGAYFRALVDHMKRANVPESVLRRHRSRLFTRVADP